MQIPAELEIARGAAAVRLHGRGGRALHALARHAPLRKFQRGFLAACRDACTSIFTISTPIAAGPTIWATKFPIPREPWSCSNDWDQELRDCYAGKPSHPVFIALQQNDFRAATFPSSRFPICSSPFARTRPCIATRPGTMCSIIAAIPRIRWGAWCCILCGYRDAGAPAAFRCHLHGAATREFLAGRHPRSGERTHLHSAGGSWRARPHRRRHRGAPVRRALRFADEGFDCAHAGAVRGRACRSPAASIPRCAWTSKCSAAAGWRCWMPSKPSDTTRSSTGPRSRNRSSFRCWCGRLSFACLRSHSHRRA